MERRFAPRVVELRRLLREQRVDVRIAAVGIGAALRDECLEAGRGVAEGAAGAPDQVLETLLRVSLEEGRALQRSELGADAGLFGVVERSLFEGGIRCVAEILARLEAVWVTPLRPDPPAL